MAGSARRFWAAFIFFFVAYVVNDVSSGVAMWRMPKGAGWPPRDPFPVLPDLGYDTIPYFGSSSQLPTYVLVVFMLVTGARFLLLDSRRWAVAIRWMIIDGVLLFSRAVTIISTSLNNPDPRCNHCGSECPTTVWGAVWMTVSRFPFWSCGDLMFSGHTVHFLLMTLAWQSYSKSRLSHIVAWLFSFAGMALLLSCRYHYTIDVLVALVLTLLLWDLYHFSIPTQVDAHDRGTPVLGGVWRLLQCAVHWLEQPHVDVHRDDDGEPLVRRPSTTNTRM